ncbi:UDP-N-acetylglucosamine transferase subunit [Blastocladiella emersonii ATCC 22665]|nr:UDP-N-acetylglucosamine transferase subunit [Blastocladiella emersonii ATCC 22665]
MLVVLGSGGHTMEMLQLLRTVTPDVCPYARVYVVARGDEHSLARVAHFEVEQAHGQAYHVRQLPRARRVGQSFWTAPWTTLVALVHAVWIVYSEAPRLLLVNGPGTCLPLCLAASALRCIGLIPTRQLFIESVARVQTLSLSAKLYYHLRLGDLAVQWPQLAKAYPRARHRGLLI